MFVQICGTAYHRANQRQQRSYSYIHMKKNFFPSFLLNISKTLVIKNVGTVNVSQNILCSSLNDAKLMVRRQQVLHDQYLINSV